MRRVAPYLCRAPIPHVSFVAAYGFKSLGISTAAPTFRILCFALYEEQLLFECLYPKIPSENEDDTGSIVPSDEKDALRMNVREDDVYDY